MRHRRPWDRVSHTPPPVAATVPPAYQIDHDHGCAHRMSYGSAPCDCSRAADARVSELDRVKGDLAVMTGRWKEAWGRADTYKKQLDAQERRSRERSR